MWRTKLEKDLVAEGKRDSTIEVVVDMTLLESKLITVQYNPSSCIYRNHDPLVTLGLSASISAKRDEEASEHSDESGDDFGLFFDLVT